MDQLSFSYTVCQT